MLEVKLVCPTLREESVEGDSDRISSRTKRFLGCRRTTAEENKIVGWNFDRSPIHWRANLLCIKRAAIHVVNRRLKEFRGDRSQQRQNSQYPEMLLLIKFKNFFIKKPNWAARRWNTFPLNFPESRRDDDENLRIWKAVEYWIIDISKLGHFLIFRIF